MMTPPLQLDSWQPNWYSTALRRLPYPFETKGAHRVSSKSKRQQTAAKRTREQAVRERRELKQQKKQAAAAERRARAAGNPFPTDPNVSDREAADALDTGAGD